MARAPLPAHARALITGNYLQADETPIRCNDPDHERGKTLQCYLWVISRPKSDVVFAFRGSRSHDELPSLLGSFHGHLQSDQYGAYASHERKTAGIVRVGCWAHARPKFHEALEERPKAANLVLKIISQLYRLEAEWDEANVGEVRAALRQEHFTRPLRWLKRIVTGLARQTLPQSQLGKACTYLLNHWEVLVAHQQHSITRIDNNLLENAIRPSAIGKKNWLFIGHPVAGQRSAIIYSLVVLVPAPRQGPARVSARRPPPAPGHDQSGRSRAAHSGLAGSPRNSHRYDRASCVALTVTSGVDT